MLRNIFNHKVHFIFKMQNKIYIKKNAGKNYKLAKVNDSHMIVHHD